MTLNGAIMELVMLSEHPIMPVIFKPSIQKIIETVSECEEPQERKTGRWNKDRLPALNGGSYEVFRCSECQSAFNWRMEYCGHCGARMDSEQILSEADNDTAYGGLMSAT